MYSLASVAYNEQYFMCYVLYVTYIFVCDLYICQWLYMTQWPRKSSVCLYIYMYKVEMAIIQQIKKKIVQQIIDVSEIVKSLILFNRYGCYRKLKESINSAEGSLEKFTKGYEIFGIHRLHDNSVLMREWAPGAEGLYLRGDFSK